jgi:mycothiol system anti-sigma-R factor
MNQDNEKYRIEDLMGIDNCQDALHTLYNFLDGELTPERRAAIQRHLDQCSPCLRAFDWEAELKMVVARCCKDQVPDHLRVRIAVVLAEAEASERNRESYE